MSTAADGKLTNMGFVRPKYVIAEGIRKKISEDVPKLAHTIDLTFDYPKRETFANSHDGTRAPTRRRLVIKKLSSVPISRGIGDVYATSQNFVNNDGEGGVYATEAIGLGQVDEQTIEITVWTPDSKDRDTFLELIKLWMLELTQRIEPETGDRFFNRNGVFSVKEAKNYENIDRRKDQTDYYLGILVYKVLCPFYGTQVETFTKYKYELINSLYDQPKPQITIPNVPTPREPENPGTVTIPTPHPFYGPGGNPSKEEDETLKIPEPKFGGMGEGRVPDTLFIPGERTEGGYQQYDLALLHEED